ncbi:sulfatase-like hydrolase/transferase [Ideonella sp. YS5]|uniref:sulfatase-like hydrolase/transferase n=1 Tax=Ideonella sp. YS5 TaxID=3453714 RepID=UPI003EE924D2
MSRTPGAPRAATSLRTSRRDALKTLGTVGLSGLAGLAGTAGSPSHARMRPAVNYNILWLMADEHNPFVAGFAGDRVVQTPALDALARRGTVFSSAYTPDPICESARRAFCSGRMASNINSEQPNYEALGPYFGRMGYHTGWFGKQHWDNLVNPFDEVGEDCDKVVRQRFIDAGLQYPQQTRLVRDATVAYWGTDLNEDTVATEQALGFLDAIGSQRFFLGVSYVKPHFPFCIQPEYFARYADVQIRRPRVTQAMLDDLSTAMKNDRSLYEIDKLSAAQEDYARRSYYGMVSYMDDQVGRVLARLDALGLREQTIVLYMSDHGEMLGQHGIWYKNTFLEGSARVPVIVSLPSALGAQLRSVNAPISTIDLFPTLCELCGLPPPATLEGRSLIPLMTGQDAGSDRVAFSENNRCGIPARMIRTRRFKYCWYADGIEQLYDMHGPDRDIEGTNLVADPAYATIVQNLRRRALAGWNPDGLWDGGGA